MLFQPLGGLHLFTEGFNRIYLCIGFNYISFKILSGCNAIVGSILDGLTSTMLALLFEFYSVFSNMVEAIEDGLIAILCMHAFCCLNDYYVFKWNDP